MARGSIRYCCCVSILKASIQRLRSMLQTVSSPTRRSACIPAATSPTGIPISSCSNALPLFHLRSEGRRQGFKRTGSTPSAGAVPENRQRPPRREVRWFTWRVSNLRLKHAGGRRHLRRSGSRGGSAGLGIGRVGHLARQRDPDLRSVVSRSGRLREHVRRVEEPMGLRWLHHA